MLLYNTPARILKKGKEPIEDGIEMLPIEYLEPYCHGEKMVSIFTYRDEKKGMYEQFQCRTCKHVESRHVAVPNKGGSI